MCHLSTSSDQRTATDPILLRGIIHDGQKYDRCRQWRSFNGQNTSSSKASDLQYGKQYTEIWDQRAKLVSDGEQNRCSFQSKSGESADRIDIIGETAGC
ncbi:hypothetical protein CR513_35312, partial [Mucuna pruriens]